MSKRIDLVGQKFNHLTVLALDEEKSKEKKKSYWFCECDCGYTIPYSISSYDLKSNNTTKCKYCRAENLIGKRFEKLVVIERVINEKNKVMWKCKCDCGNETIVRPDSLKSGHTRSCGCLQKEIVKKRGLDEENMIGQRFGKLTVLSCDYKRTEEGKGSYWFCKCDCGTSNHSVSKKSLKMGRTVSCGCIKSKGEEKISQILQQNNIPFEKEVYINDYIFSTGGHPKIDFVVNKIFIEYQGEQHYKARESGYFNQEKVNKIKIRDLEKRQYCKNNNIKLIEIPYWDYDKLSLEYLIEKGLIIE